MSTQTQFSQTDLVFRFVGGQNDGSLVPVSTSKCLLGKDENHNAKCAVYRSAKGTTIKSLTDDVLVNNNAVDVEWLKQGDRITVGASILEVIQIGQHSGVCDEQLVPNDDNQVGKTDQSQSGPSTEEHILSPLNNISSQIDDQLALEDKSEQKLDVLEITPVEPEGADALAQLVASTSSTETKDCSESDLPENQARHEQEPNDPAWIEKSDRDKNPERTVPPHESPANAETPEDVTQALNALLPDQVNSSNQADVPQEGASKVVPAGSLLEQFINEPESPVEPEPVAQPQSESVAEVLARMQKNGELDSFSEAESEPSNDTPSFENKVEPEIQQAPVAEETSTTSPTNEPGPENGESVQDYMTQLFQRLRGNDADKPAAASTKVAAKPTATKPVEVHEVGESSPSPVPVEMLTPDEYKPKTTAPERNRNLDAMRELANEQAHNAIYLSQLKRRKAITLSCLCIVAIGLGLAGYTFAISKGLDMQFFVGSACVMISCVAGYRCASVFLGWDLEKLESAPFPMQHPEGIPKLPISEDESQ